MWYVQLQRDTIQQKIALIRNDLLLLQEKQVRKPLWI